MIEHDRACYHAGKTSVRMADPAAEGNHPFAISQAIINRGADIKPYISAGVLMDLKIRAVGKIGLPWRRQFQIQNDCPVFIEDNQ